MTRETLTRRYAIHQFIHWTIVGITIPVLVLLFQSRGLNLQEVGLVMAVWVGSTAVLEVPFGGIADKYGRKVTYLGSLIVNILGCGALFYASELVGLLVAAVMLGASRAIYSGTLDAWFFDSFQRCPQHKLTFHSAQAYVNISVTVGLAVGALFGGWLPDYLVSSSVMANTSVEMASAYDANIAVVIVANIVLFVITHQLINEVRGFDKYSSDQAANLVISAQVIRKAFTHHVIKRLMQTTLVYGAVLSSVETFWQPYLMALMQSTANNAGVSNITVFGVIAGLYFLMSALSSLLSIRLLTYCQGSHKTLLLATRVLAGLTLMAMAKSGEPLVFALLYLTFFFFFTLGNSSQSVLINENTEAEHRSTMLSVSSLTVTGGAVLASLLFGVVSERYGISLSWMMCGGGLVVSSLLFVLIPERQEITTG